MMRPTWLAAAAIVTNVLVGGFAAAAEDTATLTMTREAQYESRNKGLHVYINNEFIASIPDGESKTLTFRPQTDRKNTVQVKITILGFASDESPKVELNLGKGGRATANCSTGADITRVVIEDPGESLIKNVTVRLDEQVAEREVASEIVETLPGLKRTITRTRTIEHSVGATDSKSLEGAVRLNFGVIGGEIRRKVETELNQTFKTSESVEQKVEIDGDKLPRVKLVWIEKYRTGTSRMEIDGAETKIPFRFTTELELRCVRVSEK